MNKIKNYIRRNRMDIIYFFRRFYKEIPYWRHLEFALKDEKHIGHYYWYSVLNKKTGKIEDKSAKFLNVLFDVLTFIS